MKIFPQISLRGIGLAVLRILLLTYVAFGIILYVQQDSYIFFPPMVPMEDCTLLSNSRILTIDGTRAYYAVSGSSTKIAVVYHGNGGRACDLAELVQWLVGEEYNVLAVEYAGYAGDVTQKPTVKLLLRDTEHVYAWVKEQRFSQTLIIGQSIGTGFASYHASLASPEKLVLLSPFDTLSQATGEHYPIYPTSILLKTDLNNVKNASFAKEVLVIHGAKDVIVPITRGKSLFEKLSQKQKVFITLEGYEHNDVLDAPQSWSAMSDFLDER